MAGSMQRRQVLTGLGAIASLGLLGCQSKSATLRVRLLQNSIPKRYFPEVEKQLDPNGTTYFDLITADQLQQLFDLLQQWKLQAEGKLQLKPPLIPFWGTDNSHIPDLVGLSDSWLSTAIRQKLIQPLDEKALKQWQSVPPAFQTIVRRSDRGEVDSKGRLYGIPYRWGSTVIVYRKDIFQRQQLPPPTDWADLWRSDLQGRISLLNQPREVIGLTLKKLGQSYNRDRLDLPDLAPELQALHRQAKFYSSSNYLQPLILGETWVAVGWSSDILPQLDRQQTLAAIVPSSGTALWMDLWVRPSGHKDGLPSMAEQWLNYWLRPEMAVQYSLLADAASPQLATLDRSQLPPELQTKIKQQPILLPSPETLQRSEFITPLPDQAIDAYRDLWKKIRQA
jgi:putative spermidine/putrescine transport system substrate-binding protein